jgi:phosphate starvation-inducible PhoH-like protein
MSKKAKKAHKPDTSPYIYQRELVKDTFFVREQKWTEKQQKLIQLLLDKDTKMVFINGPAGTAKTFTAIYSALKMIADKQAAELIYVRSIIESASKGIGALPGEIVDKLSPFLMPLEDKMREMLHTADIQRLLQEERVKGIPINFLRGGSFNRTILIGDEVQNFTAKEIITLITRLGKHSKMILCGDTLQSDIGDKSGFKKLMDIFNDEESRANGVHFFEFTREDILRSEVLKFIIEKLEKNQQKIPS